MTRNEWVEASLRQQERRHRLLARRGGPDPLSELIDEFLQHLARQQDRASKTRRHQMSGHANLTIVGNLTADPDLRVTAGGDAVASFTVAATPRLLDRGSGMWSDGETLYLRCSAWRQLAENVAESLTSGTRVWVQGRLKQRSFETRDGDKRTVIELDVDEIGPSLRFATTAVHRVPRQQPDAVDSESTAEFTPASAD
jgi:single-strand DNA-binding protein